MASLHKNDCEEETEDDLEKLRLAALQSLHTSKAAGQTVQPVRKFVKEGVKTEFRNKGNRELFNGKKHCYRVNSNLITIVPVLDVSKQNTSECDAQQSHNEKTGDSSQVSSKFKRYEDESDNSEEEAVQINSGNINADTSGRLVHNSLVEENEDESLDKLMDQLEQEINASGGVYVNSEVSKCTEVLLPNKVVKNDYESQSHSVGNPPISHTTVCIGTGLPVPTNVVPVENVTEIERNPSQARIEKRLFSPENDVRWPKLPDSCANSVEGQKGKDCLQNTTQNHGSLLRSHSPVDSQVPLHRDQRCSDVLSNSSYCNDIQNLSNRLSFSTTSVLPPNNSNVVLRTRSNSKSPIHVQKRSRSRSPLRMPRTSSRSPEKTRRTVSRSSARMRRTISRSPIRTKRTISRSPIHMRRTISRSPIRVMRSVSRSPIRRRRTISRSPVRRMRSVSRSPVRMLRSTSRSPVRRLRSISRSPVWIHRSRSPSPPPFRILRSPSRRSPFHKRRSISPRSPVRTLRTPMCLPKYQGTRSPGGRVESRSPKSPLCTARYSNCIKRSRSPRSPEVIFRVRSSKSPIHKLRSRSPRSPVRSGRSCSPRSPVCTRRSRTPLSPVRLVRSRNSVSPTRLRRSRSPVPLKRSRSPARSPVQVSRSPLRKYSISPQSRYSNKSLSPHYSYASRKRSVSPRARHYASPKNSTSSWQRRQATDTGIIRSLSPLSHDRIISARKCSVSPNYQRQSLSPVSRYVGSPHLRRMSVSPGRHSPEKIRRSPSAPRDNRSPVARCSPLRRSKSPMLRRMSRSRSLSPGRFHMKNIQTQPTGRAWSPLANKGLGGSPVRRNSPSVVQRNVSSLSPKIHRKSSPWSPVRLATENKLNFRIDDEPIKNKLPVNNSRHVAAQVRNPESYVNKKNSPNRTRNVQLLKQHCTVESEMSPQRKERQLSQSKKSCLNRGKQSSLKLEVDLPQKQSPSQKSWSRTPSLSPSPEKSFASDQHRHKSPLRIRLPDHRKHPMIGVSKRDEGMSWQKSSTFLKTQDTCNSGKIFRDKLGKNESRRTELTNRNLMKQGVRRPARLNSLDQNQKERTKPSLMKQKQTKPRGPSPIVSESISDNASVLEARKRKFGTSFPVEPSNKVVSLKGLSKVSSDKGPSKAYIDKGSSKTCVDKSLSKAPVSKDSSTVSVDKSSYKAAEESSLSKGTTDKDKLGKMKDDSENWCEKTIDELEDLLDLELQNSVDLWPSDGSESDNDDSFKLHDRWSSSKEENDMSSAVKVISGSENSDAKDSSCKMVTAECGDERTNPSKGCNKPKEQKNRIEVSDAAQLKKTRLNTERSLSNKHGSKENKIKASRNEQEKRYSSRKEKESDEHSSDRDGDLRAELSRRRAERLMKAGSLHEILPARLLQSAIQGAVGSRPVKKEIDDSKLPTERDADKRDKTDGRRVMVLKSPPTCAEQDVLSFSVTIPKVKKEGKCQPKVPVHLRLGLPSNNWDNERPSSRRRGYRKVKLKRNVLLSADRGHKV